jgi:hypothetical protein
LYGSKYEQTLDIIFFDFRLQFKNIKEVIMRTFWLKSSRAGLLIFWIVLLISPAAHAATGTDWGDIILSPNPQMDLKQVLQVGLPDLEGQIRQTFRDNIDKIKQIQKNVKDQTEFSAGMTYSVTLGGTDETGKVTMEYDIMDLAGWDGKSDLPVKMKIEKKDAGTIEVSYDPKAPYLIKEIKIEKKMPGGVVSQSGTLTIEGTREKPEVKITYGQKAETSDKLSDATGLKGEVEQSIGLDMNRSADDLYDPEWNPRSEWMIVRGIEEIIAKTTWAVKFSGKKETDIGPGEKIAVGIDETLDTDRVRSWWTDWLFSDMNEAYDRLDAQLDSEAQWRRDKITAEADRLGIKTEGKTNQQLISAIQTAWNANPNLRHPIFRNPGPRVQPANLTTGSGVRSGNNATNQPGVTLGAPPATTGTQGSGNQGNWKDPNAGWKDPNAGWKDPNAGWKDPNEGWTDPYK